MNGQFLLKLIATLCLIFQGSPLFSKVSYFYIGESYSVGMFAQFSQIAGILNEYDTNPGKYGGVEIDFKKTGFYYDPAYGPNWWNYFCEPICIGNKQGCSIREFKAANYRFDFKYALTTLTKLKREEVFNIIQKYIKIRPHILDKVDSFVQKHFTANNIVAVHYRGTDKKKETLPVPYKTVINTIKNYIDTHSLVDYKIFVASDEESFVIQMRNTFPEKIIAYSTERSTNSQPIHESLLVNQYKSGEEAMIDCLLLSKGDVLIRTDSNLSQWSSFFNPTIPVIFLEQKATTSNVPEKKKK